jgi:probable HAF family extracellular repeat protein
MLRPSSVLRPRSQPQLEVLEDRLAPAGFAVTDLGVPGGYSSFHADAINASGQIVGQATAASGAVETFLYNHGQWTDLGMPSGNEFASPIAINNSGQVLAGSPRLIAAFDQAMGVNLPGGEMPIGLQPVPWTLPPALLYSNGQWTNLGVPSGAANLNVDGLDDARQVLADGYVGSGASTTEHLFLYSNGQWTDLGPPSGAVYFSGSPSINDSGQIIATGTIGGGISAVNHVLLYSNGQWTDLGAPNGVNGGAYNAAINSSGQVVAEFSKDTFPGGQPYLYSNGQWTNLGMPSGYTNLSIDGIDDAGEILADTGVYAEPVFPIVLSSFSSAIAGPNRPFPTTSHALLYRGGQWIDLNNFLPPGSNPYSAHINDNGQILVSGSDGQAYLLTPQQTTSVATTTALNVSSANVPAGQAVTLTATVSGPGVVAPNGSVTFFDGSIALGTVLLTDGTASLTTTLPAGSNNITALYNGFALGNFIYQSSISTVQTVTVSSPSGNGGSTPPTKVGNPVAEPVSAPTPVGGLSLLGLGFAPGWQPDVFEVDQAGQVFAVPLLSFFEGTAHPTFVNNDVALSNTQLFEGSLVSFLHGSNGQPYLMDLLTTNTTYLAEAIADAALNPL